MTTPPRRFQLGRPKRHSTPVPSRYRPSNVHNHASQRRLEQLSPHLRVHLHHILNSLVTDNIETLHNYSKQQPRLRHRNTTCLLTQRPKNERGKRNASLYSPSVLFSPVHSTQTSPSIRLSVRTRAALTTDYSPPLHRRKLNQDFSALSHLVPLTALEISLFEAAEYTPRTKHYIRPFVSWTGTGTDAGMGVQTL